MSEDFFSRNNSAAKLFSFGSRYLSTLLLATIVALMLVSAAEATVCTHYASPTGTGNGLSLSSPFKISNFWSLAGPGKTLCLLDGTFTGSDSMITPPSGLSGAALTPITIAAMNDGRVRINGQGVRNPLILRNNDWFVIEGINVSDSSGTVVLIDTGADNIVIRRVCAWNASATTSHHVWAITESHDVLLEDVCGFGTGRKIFSHTQSSSSGIAKRLTIRRAWGRWEKNTSIGPKATFEHTYDSYDATYENIIGTWDETAMEGAPLDQPYGIFSTAGLPQENQCSNGKFLGSIAYVRSTDKAASWLGGLFGARSVDCITIRDIAIYIEPGTHTNLRPILGQKFDGIYKTQTTILNAPFSIRQFINVTEIGGSASYINADPVNGWTKTNHVDVDTVAAAPNLFNGAGSMGARICKRYRDGVLTNEPLWPWPMNQRIKDAMVESGRASVDVTKTIESMFGPIPSACTASGSPTTVSIPATPGNLKITIQ
jgi:hypothetical protein